MSLEPMESDLPSGLTDALTGLPNRAFLTSALPREVSTNPSGFSLLFMDLDEFKITNDTHGHPAGDMLLRTAAHTADLVLRHESEERPGDILARGAIRFGGDEIAGILRGVTTDEHINGVIDRLRRALGAKGIEFSVGVKVHEGETASDLLAAADKLMYEDKERRRLARAKMREAYEREQFEIRFRALPRRKQVAYRMGQLLGKYSGLNEPR